MTKFNDIARIATSHNLTPKRVTTFNTIFYFNEIKGGIKANYNSIDKDDIFDNNMLVLKDKKFKKQLREDITGVVARLRYYDRMVTDLKDFNEIVSILGLVASEQDDDLVIKYKLSGDLFVKLNKIMSTGWYNNYTIEKRLKELNEALGIKL